MTVIEYQLAVADTAAVIGACLAALFVWFMLRARK
jgi:hypothetical protein